jgi:hypothetical protein
VRSPMCRRRLRHYGHSTTRATGSTQEAPTAYTVIHRARHQHASATYHRSPDNRHRAACNTACSKRAAQGPQALALAVGASHLHENLPHARGQ